MRSLEFSIETRAGALRVLAESVVAGAPLVVVGPNGAGKSSLLLALLGLRPARGQVRLDGTVLADDRAGVNLAPEARHLGYVPQDLGLFPHLTVLENVAFATACRRPDLPRTASHDLARARLAELDAIHLAGRRPQALSGGERQRVALARALAGDPRALLLDEPLGALDAAARRSARALIQRQISARDLPAIVVTHDPDDVRAFGGEVMVLEEGRVVQRGPFGALRAAPATEFVKTLLSATPEKLR